MRAYLFDCNHVRINTRVIPRKMEMSVREHFISDNVNIAFLFDQQMIYGETYVAKKDGNGKLFIFLGKFL